MKRTALLTVVETEPYLSRARKRLTSFEQAEVVLMIANDPQCGDLMTGTGGVRKVRYGTEGVGKSGGVRVIYYFHDDLHPAYLFTVFAKNEKDNLSDAEKKALHGVVSEIKREHRRTR